MTQMYDIAGAQSKPNQKQKHRSIRSEEHTSELQSQSNLVCRLLLEKKKNEINELSCAYCNPKGTSFASFLLGDDCVSDVQLCGVCTAVELLYYCARCDYVHIHFVRR